MQLSTWVLDDYTFGRPTGRGDCSNMSDGEASVLAVVDNLCTGEKHQVNATHVYAPPF